MCYRIVILVLFLFSGLSHAQESRHYTAADGLLGTDVTAICENENFLWIATNEGLNRFDGREFKAYKKESGCSNCLSENNIETLMFDSSGLLWIGLKTGGVDIYDPRKDQFTNISRLIGTYPHRVVSIYEDSQKNIWLGSWEEGVYLLEPVPEQPLAYNVANHYSGQIVSSIIEKPEGNIWIGTYFKYYIYNIEKKQWLDLDNQGLMVTELQDTGEKNAIWCSTWEQGLIKIAWDGAGISSVKTEQYLGGDRNLYCISQAAGNSLYLGTWGEGLKMVGVEPHRVYEIPVNSDIKSPVILCLFRDRYNKFWVGTYGNGLYRLNTEEGEISHFEPINRNGISAVYKIHQFGESRVLIGTQGDGLYLYDLESRKLTPKRANISSETLFTNYILSLYGDDELLMVGHDGTGIYYTSLRGKKDGDFVMKEYFADSELAKVTSIFRDKHSTIWLGTKQNGLISINYDPVNGVFSNYTHYESFARDEITGFTNRDDDHLWISTHSGLYLFNTKTNQLETNGRPVISDMIYSLLDDSRNKCLWLGTSVGLRQMAYSDSGIKQVFPAELLPEGAILDLSLDKENNLWFSVADRVFCFVDNSKELKEINTGIFGDQIIFSSTGVDIDGKGYMAFGGTDRILLIDPQATLLQPNQTKIVLTELQVDHQKVNVGEKIYGKVVLGEASEYVKSISLSHLCKWISLSLSEVGWDHFRNKYQYRIEGFSDSWQYFDISKPLTFSQLQPGEYTLFIRHHEVSPENEPYWSFHIVIRPPWWQTWWFYGSLILLAFATLVITILVIRNYYKKRQHQRLVEIEKRKKEELLQEKESFFAGLSHDLMTPFSLIIAPANDLLREKDLSEDKLEKLEIISKNASFLSDIFSSMLDLKRAEMIDAEIREKTVELVSFCRIIVNAFDYLAKSKNITLDFKSSMSELTVSIDTVKLERVIYNLLSNALKFTPNGGEVHVSLTIEDNDHFNMKIVDTGSGIESRSLAKVFDKFYQGTTSNDKNAGGLGLGLYIVRKFVDMLGGEIHVESELSKGTIINVDLPINRIEKIIVTDEKTEWSELPSILLVEDNSQLLDYLKKKLSTHFHVTTATNGVEALEFVKKNFPEMVISDIMMPEMDGLELCTTIKSTPLLSDIFVVLLSAKSSTEDELQGYKAGADFYMKKPFDSDVLIKQVLNVYLTRQQRKKQIINELLSSSPQDKIDSLPKDDFLGKAAKVIEEHLMDENFRIEEFATEMNLSKTVLHRKFKVIVGETPTIFIRNVRLHKAAELLKNSELSVAEIAYLTGFSQSHYFIKCFKELFNDTPKNYRKQQKVS